MQSHLLENKCVNFSLDWTKLGHAHVSNCFFFYTASRSNHFRFPESDLTAGQPDLSTATDLLGGLFLIIFCHPCRRKYVQSTLKCECERMRCCHNTSIILPKNTFRVHFVAAPSSHGLSIHSFDVDAAFDFLFTFLLLDYFFHVFVKAQFIASSRFWKSFIYSNSVVWMCSCSEQ